mmetsp:Transcript_86444/g.231593  ORF Transcript_86444/g.231593 Transcript_86444/m.231593 type:complete len:218 (+) Transcript_86444:458-1111(+)
MVGHHGDLFVVGKYRKLQRYCTLESGVGPKRAQNNAHDSATWHHHLTLYIRPELFSDHQPPAHRAMLLLPQPTVDTFLVEHVCAAQRPYTLSRFEIAQADTTDAGTASSQPVPAQDPRREGPVQLPTHVRAKPVHRPPRSPDIHRSLPPLIDTVVPPALVCSGRRAVVLCTVQVAGTRFRTLRPEHTARPLGIPAARLADWAQITQWHPSPVPAGRC